MGQDSIPKRLYDETEIGALIQRATELHEEGRGTSGGGLSLSEIERVAAELGLPAEHVRAAALELAGKPSSAASFNLWGNPFMVTQARVVDGTMGEEDWARLVLELRRFTGSTGRASEFGSVREWTRGTEDMGMTIEKTQVTVDSKDGQTSIQARKHYGGAATLAYLLSFVLSATVTGITLDGGGLPDLANFALVGGGGAGGLAVVRASLLLWAKQQRARLGELTELLHRTLSVSTPQSLENNLPTKQIDLPEMDESGNGSVLTKRRART